MRISGHWNWFKSFRNMPKQTIAKWTIKWRPNEIYNLNQYRGAGGVNKSGWIVCCFRAQCNKIKEKKKLSINLICGHLTKHNVKMKMSKLKFWWSDDKKNVVNVIANPPPDVMTCFCENLLLVKKLSPTFRSHFLIYCHRRQTKQFSFAIQWNDLFS